MTAATGRFFAALKMTDAANKCGLVGWATGCPRGLNFSVLIFQLARTSFVVIFTAKHKNPNNHHFRVGNKLPTLRFKITVTARFFVALKMTANKAKNPQ
ncbi:MAG: hypothetical protein IJ566_06985 [Cardiobacteriaceae bacterium]|nr:hypothetical protein [Cardiobacteriaceae bacterium]